MIPISYIEDNIFFTSIKDHCNLTCTPIYTHSTSKMKNSSSKKKNSTHTHTIFADIEFDKNHFIKLYNIISSTEQIWLSTEMKKIPKSLQIILSNTTNDVARSFRKYLCMNAKKVHRLPDDLCMYVSLRTGTRMSKF